MNGLTVFLGLKGGVGSTAAVIRHMRTARGPVTAIDLDLPHGDLAQRLGIATSSTIADLCVLEDGEIDDLQLAAVRYPVPGTPATVVPSPASPELAEILTPTRVSESLQMLCAQSPVVVDAGSHVDVPVLTACLLADRIVLVARPDSSCLRMAALVQDLLDRAGVGAPRFVLVRGRASKAFCAECGLPPWPLDSRRRFPALRRDLGSSLRILRGSQRRAHAWER